MTYRPNVSLPRAIAQGRGNPRTTYQSVADRGEADKLRKINKVICEGPDVIFGINNVPQHVYNIGGDHLYCAEIIGSMPCSVRLDGSDGPLIRLEEGMVLRRPFNRFIVEFDYVLVQDTSNQPIRTPATQVTLYATYGPFIIEKPEKPYGAHPGFASRFECVATTTPKIFCDDLLGEFNILWRPNDQFGRGGATVIINNEDAGNDLYIKYTDELDVAPSVPLAHLDWFPLHAGQSFSATVESLIRRTLGTSISGIYVATVTGTCKYSFLISRSPLYGPPEAGYTGPATKPT